MKKKLLIFTLCFTLIFSSFNYRKSYADVGIVSAPMILAVSSLAVYCGIQLNSEEGLIGLCNNVYNYYSDRWEEFNTAMKTGVFVAANGLLTYSTKFFNMCKDAFNSLYGVKGDDMDNEIYIPGYGYTGYVSLLDATSEKTIKEFGSLSIQYSTTSFRMTWDDVYVTSKNVDIGEGKHEYFKLSNYNNVVMVGFYDSDFKIRERFSSGKKLTSLGVTSGGVVSGSYDSSKDKPSDDDKIYCPSNIGSLVGKKPSDLSNPDYEVSTDGVVSSPIVDNPPFNYEDTGVISRPSVDSPSVDSPSVPNEGIWSTIKEFIISLVVPSDSFWTDTWGGLYNNFTSSFPMVDMDNFNDLVTNEKKFPNIDVNIMGVRGRVVNGDVVNSIVDWLRPIIAGFMMLCLMLFNYRKIYKLIRNSEPFGSVASGNNSDIRTGISEYSKHEVVKATDMVAEYRAWRERGGK